MPLPQRLARSALNRQLNSLGAKNVRDAAAIVVDNVSGDVLAYVDSAGPRSRAAAVDGVRAPRQAGSTLKPFLYELALERKYLTAASLLDDVPVNIDTATGVYVPQDYDHDYKGPVSVRTALAGSAECSGGPYADAGGSGNPARPPACTGLCGHHPGWFLLWILAWR